MICSMQARISSAPDQSWQESQAAPISVTLGGSLDRVVGLGGGGGVGQGQAQQGNHG